MKKYIKLFICIIVIMLSCVACKGKQNIDKLPEKKEKTSEAVENMKKRYVKEAFIDKEDGWIYYIHVTKFEGENKLSYEFDGVNMKYYRLDGYYIPMYDENDKEIGQCGTEPMLSYSKKTEKDVESVVKYLEKKQFGDNDITEQDMKELKLTSVSKKDVVEIYNKLNDLEYIDVGADIDMLYLSFHDIQQKNIDDKTKLQVAYYNPSGGIRRMHIDILYNNNGKDEYLSDLVENGTASQQQKDLYINLGKIGQSVIDNQSFAVEKNFTNLQGKEYDALFKYLNETDKNLMEYIQDNKQYKLEHQ